MKTKSMKPLPITSLATLAREALRKCDGDERAAADEIKARLGNEPELKAELLEPLIDRAVWKLLQSMRTKRTSPVSTPHCGRAPTSGNEDSSSIEETTGLRGLAAANFKDLLTFRLRHAGVPLGSASRQMLHEEIAHHERMTRENLQLALFYRRIIKSMGTAATVDRVLTNKDLQLIMSASEREVRDE